MAQINSEQLLSEMNSYLNEAASAEAETESALPSETLDDYIGDPNGFGDVTAKLWKKVSAVFDLAAKYNRHSSDYLKSCAQLERGIKFLGSSCLQKYALEQRDFVFPELKQLNTANLYTMASIHFNKIDRALSEYMEQNQAVDDALLDMEYRFYHLMERIRATEVKIYNYNFKRFYGVEDCTPVVHGLAFSERSRTKDVHKSDEPLAFQRARAFSAPAAEAHGDGFCDAASPARKNCQPVREMKNDEEWPVVADQCSEAQRDVSAAAASPARKNCQPVREMKNDEECPVIGDQLSEAQRDVSAAVAEPTQQGRTGDASNNDPVSACSDANLPPFVEILQRVMERSKNSDDGSLTFTFEEMEYLAKDPLFAHFEPAMAADIRKVLAESPPGD